MQGVPLWLWLWSAPALVVLQVATKAIDEALYRRTLRGELGLVENLTVAALLGAIACAVLCYRRRAAVRWRFFGPCLLVLVLGLVFFAGEEASWGQHWLGFEPPEAIASRNEQHEFNLHNDPFLETFLDQLPRLLLTLAAMVAVVVPLARRDRARDFRAPGPSGWVWPTLECVPAALCALLVGVPEKIASVLGLTLPAVLEISAGETKEACLALFLLVYLWKLQLDLCCAATGGEASPGSPSA